MNLRKMKTLLIRLIYVILCTEGIFVIDPERSTLKIISVSKYHPLQYFTTQQLWQIVIFQTKIRINNLKKRLKDFIFETLLKLKVTCFCLI